MMSAGRFAPSPTGDLHVGNLRTALIAWLAARSTGRAFLLRFEDLDTLRVLADSPGRQEAELRAMGIDWDEPVMWQSRRIALYQGIVARLTADGLTYECFCSRKDIRQAASAPHAPQGAYPGTCRDLTEAERAERRRTKPPAIRLRTDGRQMSVRDALLGTLTGPVDDFVLVRSDGTAAYNLVSVVDDAAQGVDQVVRGDDLASSSPRQAYLAQLLGYRIPQYIHVPLAVNNEGVRLAKRDGAVTLESLRALGYDDPAVRRGILRSLGLWDGDRHSDAGALLERFSIERIPRDQWVVDGQGAWLADR